MNIRVLQMRGLGNQLFQYAAGLYFAQRYGGKIEVIREPEHLANSFGHPRPFLLSHFCITTPVRDLSIWDRTMCSVAVHKKPIAVPARFFSRTVVYKQPAPEDGEFLDLLPVPLSTRTVYLDGNFQSYKFSEPIEQRVRAEFRFKQAPSGQNLEISKLICSTSNSVSLHVRRGDYILNKGGQELLPLAYYSTCMKILVEKLANPTFFVFSDDIQFARENLPKEHKLVFVDHNDETSGHEDLRLMSMCRNHIIANSTLSWWGAWLDPNPNKIVCAPKVWRNPKIPYNDLLPPEWLRIPNR